MTLPFNVSNLATRLRTAFNRGYTIAHTSEYGRLLGGTGRETSVAQLVALLDASVEEIPATLRDGEKPKKALTKETAPKAKKGKKEAAPIEEAEEVAPIEEAEEVAPIEEAEEAAPIEEAEEAAPIEEAEEAAPIEEAAPAKKSKKRST